MAHFPRQFLQTTQINCYYFEIAISSKSLSDIFFYIFQIRKAVDK